MNEITALQKLLKYPHSAVFNKAPAQELSLRVRHADGAGWMIADEVLTLTAGEVVRQYDLAQYTFSALADAMRADGFDVPLVSERWANKSALAAVEGSGHQYESNGDHIYAFTSLLWVLMSGYAGEVREARTQVRNALRQMVMTQAEGEWLGVWGELYGVERATHESDAAYARRIPVEAFRLRVNALAIEKAIKDITGKDVRIEEPWGDMFRLDVSRLSSTSRFFDGTLIGYHLIRPVSAEYIKWDDVLKVIERNRPAGVLVLAPEVRRSQFIDVSDGDAEIISWIESDRWSFVTTDLDFRLDDNLRLSESKPLFNYRIVARPVVHQSIRFVFASSDVVVFDVDSSTGYTWGGAGEWGRFPWSINAGDIAELQYVADKLDRYANIVLPEHLRIDDDVIVSGGSSISDGSVLSSGRRRHGHRS